MRLSSFLSTLVLLTTTTTLAAPWVSINNYLDHPIYITRVDQTGIRTQTAELFPTQTWSEQQLDVPGVAIKITPEPKDVDTAGKGVLTLGYTYTPSWVYYDLGVFLYYPFPGAKAKLSGAGGDNDWSDGVPHVQHTVGYQGETNITLDLWY
ncbi:hypothetical protein N0V90_007120 [Kalmusia sp. IMI 367209]|nr:hypothetical protein N0V90_007120 [Kalmusia sp. IMI 367209]